MSLSTEGRHGIIVGATPRAESGRRESPPRTPPEDPRASWREYFASDKDQSTETRVLQEEGDHLLKLLAKIAPGDTRETWTYADLDNAVKEARVQYESKNRLGHGRPQKVFHSLMRKFDSHSGLCKIIPSGDKYLSLVTGALTIVVQSSVNHSKSIDELSDALDQISELIGFCEVESKLVQSQSMQNAISKLYIATFLFLGDAITWYNSSSRSKLLKSLHNDFSETFRSSIERIKHLAGSVRHVAQLGSEAEVRIIRLDLEDLQEELQDTRIGMQGQLRFLAEVVRWQHGENLEQHRQTQALLVETRPMLAANANDMPQVDFDFDKHLNQRASSEHLRIQEMAHHDPAPAAPKPSEAQMMQASAPELLEIQLIKDLASKLWLTRKTANYPILQADEASSTNLHDSQISSKINRWFVSSTNAMLYLEGSTSLSTKEIPRVAAQILHECQKSSYNMAVQFSSQRAPLWQVAAYDKDTSMIDMMLNLANQIIQLLPDDNRQLTNQWKTLVELKDSEEIRIHDAAAILAASLETTPPDLHIIIDGFRLLREAPKEVLSQFFAIIRNALSNCPTGLKVIIISGSRLHNVIPFFNQSEISVVHHQGQRKKPLSPITSASRGR
ncbi:uncharacterized protein KY384_005029 [Bacidia gigantensis]|uniref:uncharacterized protein n=1 Tax=Bacidia gigantensis TaxID=2732470 RepID=UPI001D03A856|nr:uncharacterized protein KY384_005029 [Bacidia gigantensis]KAG8530526.1 hypothetical protein KY384_005029 [Bacidia gigantensis]